MLKLFIVIFFFVGCEVTSQITNVESMSTTLPNSNLEEVQSPHQEFKESAKVKRDKLSSMLNLFKIAVAEELENSYYTVDAPVHNNISLTDNNIEEKPTLEYNENQIEKPIAKNESNSENISEKITTETKSPIPNNVTQKNMEIPNMIPIFKPKPRPKAELKQTADGKKEMPTSNLLGSIVPENNVQADPKPIYTPNKANIRSKHKNTDLKRKHKSKSISFVPEKIVQRNIMASISKPNLADINSIPVNTESTQIPKTRATFVPERIAQANFNPIQNQIQFNIPCQRAADVLNMDMTPKIGCRNTNMNSIVESAKPKMTQQINQNNCSEENDTVAMLFKPKNITLEQVYGNIMKKVTLTVLVPYHVSKLGRK